MPVKTIPWNTFDYLKTPAEQTSYLDAALELASEENDPSILADALGKIARARGMTEVAEEAGVTRMALYKSLTKEGDPKLSTVLGVMKALGVRFAIREEA